ncbi:hypothetical protein Hanom_Chr15g01402271 [Helianthus anomalus]
MLVWLEMNCLHLVVQKKQIIITEDLIREELEFKDATTDPDLLDEKQVKGCFLRMGCYDGELNTTSYAKTCLSTKPYDVATDYQMSAIAALMLN